MLILLSACSSLNAENTLSFFILGTWQGEFEQIENTKLVKVLHKLTFLPFNILIYDRIAPDEKIFNVKFQYKFVDHNRIVIRGRITDECQITRAGEALIINSARIFPPDGNYERISSIWEWLFIISIVSILFIIIIRRFNSPYSPRKHK